MLLPVIMAGGSGSRLWPLSRSLYPKQFISLASDKSMLQETITRLSGLEHQAPLLICNQEHRFIVAEQLRQQRIKHGGIVLEPVGRNTAPAIALAALHATKHGDDPLLLVLAADHVIQNQAAFTQAVKNAVKPAEQGMLVTFGIVPTAPETGYGYIKQGEVVGETAYRVAQFVEKPNLATAEQYLASGEYYWNSGMFLFKASRYLKELKAHRQDILHACELAMQGARGDLDFVRIEESSFTECPEDSIDYAVMEKTQDALVVPMDAGWSDVGSFSALWEVSSKDSHGNVMVGDVIAEQTHNSYIYAQNKLVSTVGVDNLVIIETKDAVLVANKDKVQDVKNVVNQLKALQRRECEQHREVYRPWGSHDEIAEGERYHVKHLRVKPGEQTALQMHHHRAEHWVVVQGTAKVTNGDKSYLVSENQSTYIPLGSAHRIANPGKVDLHLIEVRSGSYLQEDDIVRLEEYGVGY
ncbi:TPA: mannose-1-phosphate guanylyltransferase/mannose-6-phosphate isomerase [Vibrio cholerae]|uniref:mannose-1-phosphate guanylyltransferase/mannose-6-phosphate isomerase n=1 Tax=Vibrio paracholerae TaxID=650003 RepID=UPI000DE3A796|nr:mannose-1-phosphate guanylyltransferase/mannose-6-phosphate isomerase [Vibrio paracholerae]EGR2534761.1 mannose-1-phosphate guanylyltransferase/mannose-6-phosphate isomerase [Vibrio cholerae]EGR4406708.1 mannose-1-phosphate guanylyltransferase/mannose-6-phosphate isomerase [Vibrio cholerae]RBM63623.1 mannose-1-phosphate guanylyltransferase/mannose-6-phosphate isomerase [Vibrio paracholerae]BCK15022.1 Mannose-1-phosphate guanylyltransferase 1 [Vibrio cholerae]BCN20563.1 mannose-1-phosphate g